MTTSRTNTVSKEELSDLSPNMRIALLHKSEGDEINPKDTYWITLQGLAGRGLVTLPKHRKQPYPLTKLGKAYKAELEASWT